MEETYRDLKGALVRKISSFATYSAIITDRYHGTIFALVANTPVLVIETNDHKVTSGMMWLDGVFPESSVRLVSTLDEGVEIAVRLMEDNDPPHRNDDYLFREYYQNRLKAFIESAGDSKSAP